jgi:amino acid transporter
MANKQQSDAEHLRALGYESKYQRSMSVWSTLALGFTYLSPLVAIYALFGLGLATAGPSAIWWIVIVGAGQLLVALVMGEVVSQFPIAGGIYPWMRRLAGKRRAWITAWVYVWAMLVTITSVAEFGAPFLAQVFGIAEVTPEINLALTLGLLVLALLLNMGGTKMLGRIARIGLAAELIGVVGMGLFLLVFHRNNDFSVFFEVFQGSVVDWAPLFLGAALVGLFMFYGFEACGDVAEEVKDAARQVPKAMYLTIFIGGISALFSFSGYVLAAPDLAALVDDPAPIPTVLTAAIGEGGMRLFLVIAVMAFISCVLSLQAAASRLLHSFARDEMLPASGWLSKLSERNKVPTNALLVASIIPMILAVVIYFDPTTLVPITDFAVAAIYIAFQAVVLSALIMRLRGWKPAGPWNLGGWGIVVNIAALIYGLWALWQLIVPDVLAQWGVGIVLVVGLLYLFIARPGRKSNAPFGDAIEVANKMRAAQK